MINRELRRVTVNTFSSGKDAYGQIRQNGSVPREIEMVIKLYRQSNIADIRYNEVTDIGLTKDASITDKDQIVVDGNTYNVLYVIPSGKLYQVLMKKV